VKLTFVRHGQTDSNVRDVLESDVPGPPLTAEGWTQATGMAQTLGRQKIDAIYTSTQLRALQTASALASLTGVPVHVRHGLREIECGELSGRGDSAAYGAYWDAIAAWAQRDFAPVIAGAESGAAVFKRLDAVIDEIAASGHESVVVVSHGGCIRGWTAAHGQHSADLVAKYPLDNTGIVEVVGDAVQGWSIASWMGRPLGLRV
jgi:broad specificity phosphatase PhoE